MEGEIELQRILVAFERVFLALWAGLLFAHTGGHLFLFRFTLEQRLALHFASLGCMFE
ncbi:hypothetical protein K432DRAFT_178245 [Lepidopterella palustris CBS 459.81]|uniref:Uncharacterized protein n=1 Tax=Lepidopterella palustris CBS 459.81 TaxID=1314670 RepID=A0A8E2EGB9_9PEZI|nr:hypothetical protein K432DRAFT_178245 [Lepidopterella palustris CBS 459.81]